MPLAPDPRFPDRPSSPDFERLSEVILDLDAGRSTPRQQGARMATGRDGKPSDRDSFFTGIVDPDALHYMSGQRAEIAHRMWLAGLLSDDLRHVFQTIWIEAFTVGVRFQQEGGAR